MSALATAAPPITKPAAATANTAHNLPNRFTIMTPLSSCAQGETNAGNVLTAVLVPNGVTVTSTGGGKLGVGVVYWTAPAINAGSKVTYTVTFKVSAHASGNVQVAAGTVSLANPDPNYANNAAASSITLGSPTARNVSVRQAQNPLNVGNRLSAPLKELTHRHRRQHRHP